jgi:hypothetical protein
VPTRTSEIDDRLARRFPRTLNFFSPHKAFTLLLSPTCLPCFSPACLPRFSRQLVYLASLASLFPSLLSPACFPRFSRQLVSLASLASLFPLLLSLTWLTLLPSPRKFGRIRCLLHQAHSEFVGRGAGGEGIPNEPLHIRLGQLDDR